MALSTAINLILFDFLSTINSALIFGLAIIWASFTFPLLNPNFAFPQILINGQIPPLNPLYYKNESSIYPIFSQIGMDFAVNINYLILNYIVSPSISIFIIFSGFYYLWKKQFIFHERNDYLFNIVLGIILAYFSLIISDLLFSLLRAIYIYFYSGMQINWSGTPNPYQGISDLELWPFNYFLNNYIYFAYTENNLLELLILLTLFTVVLAFTIVLVMRIVWIYFFIMFLPLFSIFLTFNGTYEIGKRMWLTFIDRSIEIIFMAPLIMLMGIIQDPLFWIAILLVSMLIPYVVTFSMSRMGYPTGYSLFPRFGILLKAKDIISNGIEMIGSLVLF
ncbi:MAG: hypothetical protein ACP5JT_01180 [Thermoplasmata archaeon]